MRRLCTDQATKKTGWSLFEEDKLIECGLIDLSKKKDKKERMGLMFGEIINLVEKHKPEVVVLESVIYESNAEAMRMLAELVGMVVGYCYHIHIPTYQIQATSWRSKIGFELGGRVKRENLKAQAINHVKEKFCLDVTDDVAEAICIGEATCFLIAS